MTPQFGRPVSRAITVSAAVLLLASTGGVQGVKPLKKCPVDAVVSGTVCMDTRAALCLGGGQFYNGDENIHVCST